MEKVVRRKSGRSRASEKIRMVGSQCFDTANNSTNICSLDSTLLCPIEFENYVSNDKIRMKASILMNSMETDRIIAESKGKKKVKLSLMSSPKKKLSRNYISNQLKIQSMNKRRMGIESQVTTLNEILEEESSNKPAEPLMSNKFLALNQYFTLVFTKMSSKPGKSKIYVLVEELNQRYERFPETIQQDVRDIRAISHRLQSALASKQNYEELRPYQVMDINGDFVRLLFNMVHQISAKKYKNYDILKIYKQIEYYSRRLQFLKLTLKVCFEIGEFLKNKSEEDSQSYYLKALKLSIFLNDRFNEQKAIDCFGLTAYSGCKSGAAFYYHFNAEKLSPFERSIIKEKYSNSEQLEQLCKMREFEKNQRNGRVNESMAYSKCRMRRNQIENFNFLGPQIPDDYECGNKNKFKEQVSQFIKCPEMRVHTLIARAHISRINKIGIIKRYKKRDIDRGYGIYRMGDELDSSNQVIMTHRSLNRINPEIEIREVEKERKLLLQLIKYFTSNQLDNLI